MTESPHTAGPTKRYRVIYSTDPSGAFREFSADTDDIARSQAETAAYGARIVVLEEVVGEHQVRPVDLTSPSRAKQRPIIPRLDIPDDWWEPNTGIDNPDLCLQGTIVVSGLPMHLEAWAVELDEDGVQQACAPEYANDFALLHSAVNGDGPFETLTIRGREYAIVATPFC